MNKGISGCWFRLRSAVTRVFAVRCQVHRAKRIDVEILVVEPERLQKFHKPFFSNFSVFSFFPSWKLPISVVTTVLGLKAVSLFCSVKCSKLASSGEGGLEKGGFSKGA